MIVYWPVSLQVLDWQVQIAGDPPTKNSNILNGTPCFTVIQVKPYSVNASFDNFSLLFWLFQYDLVVIPRREQIVVRFEPRKRSCENRRFHIWLKPIHDSDIKKKLQILYVPERSEKKSDRLQGFVPSQKLTRWAAQSLETARSCALCSLASLSCFNEWKQYLSE